MKEKYTRAVLNVTSFGSEDVIATSKIDRDNAYSELSALSGKGGRVIPSLR